MKGMVATVFALFIGISLNGQDLEWVNRMGGTGGYTEGKAIALDQQNNVYSIGKFGAGTINLDPAGTQTVTSTTQALYVQKLSGVNGNYIWGKAITATNYVYGLNSIAADAAGNVYIITQFSGTIDCDPGPGTVTYSVSTASSSVVLIKLNASGDYVYSKLFDTGFTPMSMIIAANNFVYVGGLYQPGMIDFDINAGTSGYSSASGGGFIQKLDLSWNMIWTKTFETLQSVPCIDFDNSGNVLAGGWFNGTVDFDPGAAVFNLTADASAAPAVPDAFLLKLTSAGNLSWAKQITSPGAETILSLSVDKNTNEVFIAGDKNTFTDFDPSAATATVVGGQGYIAKYSTLGNYLWAQAKSNQVTGKIVCDPAGNIVLLDKFQGSFDADPGSGTITLNAVGSFDIFILKLNGSGNFVWAGSVGGSSFDTGAQEVLDGDGNIYYTGYFESVADFDPFSGDYYQAAMGNRDAFVSRINGCAHNAPDICLVTVDSLANNNVIYWDKSLYPSADSFVVYRYDALSTNYLRIGAVAASDTNNFLIDTARAVGGPNGGDPQYSSYRYKMAIRDICGTIGTMGLYHESIFIQQNFQNFNWNAYGIEGQSSPASGYQFLRDNVGNGNWQVLVNTGGLSTTDPNYASYPTGRWRVDALGFACTTGTARIANSGLQQMMGAINTSRSNIKSPTSVGLQELHKPLAVKIYPNPATDQLSIEFPSMSDEISIEIRNVLGQLIYSQKTKQLKNRIDCSGMETGVYSVTVKSGQGQSIRKLVIR